MKWLSEKKVCFPCRLNEGFTVFLERKILGRRKGKKMVDFSYIGLAMLISFISNVMSDEFYR